MTDETLHKFARDGEVIEPLGDGKYIIQPTDGYRFGSDSVALAKFASRFVERGATVVDICSGCGIVGILVALERQTRVLGAEIDARMVDMANRSADLNGIDAKFIRADVADIESLTDAFGKRKADAAVCNPPYYKANGKPSKIAPNANSELTVDFEAAVAAAAALLKDKGELFVVFPTARLDEALSVLRAHALIPKDLIINANKKTFLVRCVSGGRDGLNVGIEEF